MPVAVSMSTALTSIGMHMPAFARVQDLNLDQVEEEGEDGDGEHDATTNLRWIEETLSSFVDEPERGEPDGKDGAESTNDLRSMVPEGEDFCSVALCDLEANDADAESYDVRGDMHSVRHDRDGVRKPATEHFDNDEDKRCE